MFGNRDGEEILMTPTPDVECCAELLHWRSIAVNLEIAHRDSSGSGSGTPLTSEERDVLAISATGRGVTEVAAILSQSADDVREALSTAITKLGARSKLEAVLIAVRAGLVELPEPTRGVTSQGGNVAGI
jgi:DNA-binding CsgD family transcriptional regulator